MAKLAVLAAVLAMFVFVDSISAYRTTVTTVEIEDGEVVHKQQSRTEQERCRRELQQQQVQLNPCERHVTKKLEDRFLSLRGVYNEDEQQQCCQQLQKIRDQQCQCHAIQEIAERLEDRFKQGQKRQELERELLENLPQRCGLQSMRQCDIRSTGLDF